jgi:hypothetical protein
MCGRRAFKCPYDLKQVTLFCWTSSYLIWKTGEPFPTRGSLKSSSISSVSGDSASASIPGSSQNPLPFTLLVTIRAQDCFLLLICPTRLRSDPELTPLKTETQTKTFRGAAYNKVLIK